MKNIQSKIKGALYGFAIGDAMGATTEFMDKAIIKVKYGQVNDIIGGGWLKLAPGEVTDDTQMMLCVCEAIEFGYGDVRNWSYQKYSSQENAMLNRCCNNFVEWLLTKPKDVGGCCNRVISSFVKNRSAKYKAWHNKADDPNSLGNGSLMRTLPIILAGLSKETAISQGRLTHNNQVCDIAIGLYYENMVSLINHNSFENISGSLVEPSGHIINTLINSLHWVQYTDNFEEAIKGAVNDGGDADTIAAITGSLAGALYGYETIPQRWIDQLDPNVKKELDKYSKLFEKINEKVCTNLE